MQNDPPCIITADLLDGLKLPKKIQKFLELKRKLKRKHPDLVAFVRAGDFYDTYCEDAIKVVEALDLVKTRYTLPSGEKVLMASLPYFAIARYRRVLAEEGIQIATCDMRQETIARYRRVLAEEGIQIATCDMPQET